MTQIDRRTFIKDSAAGLGLALSASSGCFSNRKALRRPPNILFLYSDQQRWDSLSCYDDPLFPGLTPHLNQLAQEGIRFNHAFTNQPLCGPSRACLQTGKYPTQVGCYTNDVALPLDEKTLAHHLSATGYEVGYCGKLHLASQYTYGTWPEKGYSSDSWLNTPDTVNYLTSPVPPQRRCGYKDFWLAADALEYTTKPYGGYMFDQNGRQRTYPDSQYRVDAQTDWVIDYLQNRSNEHPFFLFVSYLEPHHQDPQGLRFHGPAGYADRFTGFHEPADLKGCSGNWKDEMPHYLACCRSLDENLGRLLDTLKKQGDLDNTVIIYTSDHGDHFRTRNRTDKCSCHEGSIRIPLVVSGPGFTGGRVVNELVGMVDIAATLPAIAGSPQPSGMCGRPLQNLVTGKQQGWPEEVFIQISNHPGASDDDAICGRALRTTKWKYAVRAPRNRSLYPDSDIYYNDFLYDLENDPGERSNLIADQNHADTRNHLTQRLLHHIASVEGVRPQIKHA